MVRHVNWHLIGAGFWVAVFLTWVGFVAWAWQSEPHQRFACFDGDYSKGVCHGVGR